MVSALDFFSCAADIMIGPFRGPKIMSRKPLSYNYCAEMAGAFLCPESRVESVASLCPAGFGRNYACASASKLIISDGTWDMQSGLFLVTAALLKLKIGPKWHCGEPGCLMPHASEFMDLKLGRG